MFENNPYLWEKRNALTPDLCHRLIEKFEACPDKSHGVTANGYLPDTKQSTDLFISTRADFKKEDDELAKCLTRDTVEYYKTIPFNPFRTNLEDNGYNVQRTNPGQQYKWHHDCFGSPADNKIRLITFVWYLNDVEEGGFTEFIDGTQVKPEEGKLLLFPAERSWVHRGTPPKSNTKYICTGWLWGEFSGYHNYRQESK